MWVPAQNQPARPKARQAARASPGKGCTTQGKGTAPAAHLLGPCPVPAWAVHARRRRLCQVKPRAAQSLPLLSGACTADLLCSRCKVHESHGTSPARELSKGRPKLAPQPAVLAPAFSTVL